VAIIQSEKSSLKRKKSIWWASLINDIQPLDKIASYPEGKLDATVAYAQAADFIAYLVDNYRWKSIRKMLFLLNEGHSFNRAFRLAYGADLKRVEKKWRKQLFGGSDWLVVLTGTGAIWGAITLLFLLAYILTKKRERIKLEQMEKEEEPLDKLFDALDKLSSSKESANGADNIKIDNEGKSHTLH
jgi:hypothetical protein